MFRYVLAFLLINSRSLGFVTSFPTASDDPNNISTALSELVKRCPNPFLIQQINDHLPECRIPSTPFKQKQFECILFLDINFQLCNAARELVIANDTNKIKESVDVDTVCSELIEFKPSDLKNYPDYIVAVRQFLDKSTYCPKVCGVPDDISSETNFYCKYLRWGMNKLKELNESALQRSVTDSGKNETSNVQLINNVADNIVNQSSGTDNQPQEAAPANKLSDTPNNISDTVNNIKSNELPPLVNNVVAVQPDENQNDLNVDQVKSISNKSNEGLENVVATETKKPVNPFIAIKKPKTPSNTESIEHKPADIAHVSSPNTSTKDVMEKPNDEPADKQEDKVEEKQNNDQDYQDDEMQDGDADDAAFDGEDLPGIKSKTTKNEHTFTRISAETDMYNPNMMGKLPEGNDHFFPFFLTGIIMVVLIYVLYHNKSKVSKLFFGMLVEGRQSRRRNNRGPAYRRLDTLEQAMSTNTSAPPSKIIY